MLPPAGGRVPVPFQNKADPPELPVRTLRCLVGRRPFVAELGPKGPGMLEPGLV